MKFNWKYTAIGIGVLAVSLAFTAYLIGGKSSASPAEAAPPAATSSSNYSL